MRRNLGRCALPLALVVLSIVLAGCGSGTPDASTTTSTSTTTTTLPSATPIALSSPSGQLSFLGPVYRVSVVDPMAGSTLLPPEPTGFGETLPSLRIAYRHFGSGPNLLLVMGEHGTMSWWDPLLLSDLAQHFTVTIFDLPDVGYSENPTVPVTLDADADVTAGLIDALGLELPAVTVVGWGVGGTIALDAVVRHPHLATGLVLVDAPAPGALDVQPTAAVKAELASPLSTTIELSHLFFPARDEATRTEWLSQIDQLESDDETAAQVATSANLAASVAAESSLARGMTKLDVPVRVMTGAFDAVVPMANAKHLASAIPGAHLLVLDDAGYASFVSDETRFLSALTSFAGPA